MTMRRRPTGVGIRGIGLGLPETVRTNAWWPETFRVEHEKRAARDLTTQAGVAVPAKADPEVQRYAAVHAADLFQGTKRRRVIGEGEASSDLEARAAARALADAKLDPSDVDLLLVYSVLPDYPAPLNHPLVAEKLGLRKDVTCMSVAAGCGSFVAQLLLACRLVEAGDAAVALIVQSAVTSPITDYRTPASVVTGDGAVACVVSRLDPEYGFIAHRQVTRGDLHGGVRLVPTADPRTPWFRGDVHASGLTAQSLDVAATLVMGAKFASMCRDTCAPLLDGSGYRSEDVDFFCTSQPSAWFGKACCDALGIGHDRTANTYEEYGHLMAASAPLNLHAARASGRIQDGDLILFYSPGAGFTQSAALYRWGGERLRPPDG